jgi:CPA2 family monovalent cation:H+ antiporter-2
MTEGMLTGMVILSLTIFFLILTLRSFKQPYFIAYILAGIILGPEITGVIRQTEFISQLGELGIILLMFFVGAEIDFPNLTKNYKKSVLVSLSQLVFGFLFMMLIGYYLHWSVRQILLFSFAISISSSAIIFQYLFRTGEINKSLGILISGVLIMQDLLVVPILLVLNFMSQGNFESVQFIKAAIGGILLIIFLRSAINSRLYAIPFKENIINDHDLQVFLGFTLCFGMAWITHWFGLSPAMGAFAAGILIGQDKATVWLDKALVPFRVFFLSFFFLSVGLQLHIDFILKNSVTILFISVSILIINSFINAMILKMMGTSIRNSVYAGALLSQIGEFSFVIINVAYGLHLIDHFIYQITLAVIAASMILASLWIFVIQQFIYRLPTELELPDKRFVLFKKRK